MRSPLRWFVTMLACLALVATAVPASAWHEDFPRTKNIRPLGHSPHPATFEEPDGVRDVNSDLAFWGRHVFHGKYDGFRIIDISSKFNPRLVGTAECNGDQGDLVVWENLVVRSWNSPRNEDRLCDGEVVPAGWEGVHIFDVSNVKAPRLVGDVELPCGSHTATMAGIVDGDLIVYSNNSSSAGCVDGTRANDDPVGDFMDIIAVPLDDPGSAELVHREPLAGPTVHDIRTGCHDVGVILGDVNKAAGACNDTINVWDITDLRDPDLLFTITEPGVGINGRWHSAAFTWDGEVIVAGWEPGGGGTAECQETSADVQKSKFFYDANDGTKLGQWVLERPQGADENCTIHNYNIVPLTDGRYVAVGGHYQAGTWVVDFTDPANAESVAWVDPPSLGPGSFCGGLCQIGGAWSSYWYNDHIYESDITRGLALYRLTTSELTPAVKLRHLNPQTQDFTL
jgi:hypothetical protein